MKHSKRDFEKLMTKGKKHTIFYTGMVTGKFIGFEEISGVTHIVIELDGKTDRGTTPVRKFPIDNVAYVSK